MTKIVLWIFVGFCVILALVAAYFVYKYLREYFVPTTRHPVPAASVHVPPSVHDILTSQEHPTERIINLDVGRSKTPTLNKNRNYVKLSDGHPLGKFVADESDNDYNKIRFEHGTIRPPHWNSLAIHDPREFMVVEEK